MLHKGASGAPFAGGLGKQKDVCRKEKWKWEKKKKQTMKLKERAAIEKEY